MSEQRPRVRLPEPLLVDDDGAAAMLGVGTTFFRELLKEGRIGPAPVRLKKRKLHRVDHLRRFVAEGLPDRKEWLRILAADKKEPGCGLVESTAPESSDSSSAGGDE